MLLRVRVYGPKQLRDVQLRLPSRKGTKSHPERRRDRQARAEITSLLLVYLIILQVLLLCVTMYKCLKGGLGAILRRWVEEMDAVLGQRRCPIPGMI